jgi:LacI family transcriptional regulator
VSRTINRHPGVQPQLPRRVLKVVEEMGCFRARRRGRWFPAATEFLGSIVSEITNPFFPEIVHAFEETAIQHNYEILVTSTVHNTERMKTAVRCMLEHRVEGVAVMTFGMEESLLDDLKLRNVPLVFVDVGPARPRVSKIRTDYLQGIWQAVQQLAALRHEKIAFITGPLTRKSACARKEGFVQSMNEIGMEPKPQWMMEGDHALEGGQRAFTNLRGLKARPTTILCSNDMTAIGVMRESYGKKIPISSERSLIGFDNIHISQYIFPPLTTIEMSQAQLGRLAFQALLTDVRRELPNPKGTEYVVKTSFVLRDR